ncbi:carboxypeptidase-like regulatory domain-containing protein [Pontibacter harenae]|uniref:carboxypeptidase-like regulatory domain-containing protein n=1 Tax=Pontibacter harenae TaxID=2894083 RepID=UPI001E3B0B6B|nr:carboxypeptidase-like regulatory domain-containing protein [Pontibacter harenae]MCC9168536.1 carboxypeptidase-like regulatory domain-containing protein [Pontibacter harenae]
MACRQSDGKVISGVVVDSEGKLALPSVIIQVKAATNGTTDMDGKFSVVASANAV